VLKLFITEFGKDGKLGFLNGLNLATPRSEARPDKFLPIGPEGPVKASGEVELPSSFKNTCRKGSSMQCSKHIDYCKGLLSSFSLFLIVPFAQPVITAVPPSLPIIFKLCSKTVSLISS